MNVCGGGMFGLDSQMESLTLGADVPDNQNGVPNAKILTCVLCCFDMEIHNMDDRDEFLNHLLSDHSLVITWVNSIARLRKYLEYWKKRFEEVPYQSICTPCVFESPTDPLYFLDGRIPEDVEIRQQLRDERLKQVLALQEAERNDTSFSRNCLFCKKHFTGSRFSLFEHLITDHHLHIGAPDNIVFGNKFLDVLEEKLKNLQCFLCEKVFKDWDTLKEHMRKKQHKRINPKNRMYDRFYLVNYLDLDKNWEHLQCEDSSDEEEIELMDFRDGYRFVCLFCKEDRTDFDKMLFHMKDAHYFDFHGHKSDYHLDFYQQVKLINYIRKQVNENACTYCDETFNCYDDLMKHLMGSAHITVFPDFSRWDQPMFYFPTLENDSFLCVLEDPVKCAKALVETVVPEDKEIPKLSCLCDEQLRNSLM